MSQFESLTDSLRHAFPSEKMKGLRVSRLGPSEQQCFSPDEIAQFPTNKHRTKIPYLTFKPKTQFTKHYPPSDIYQQYKSVSKGEIEISSVLKHENTAMNSVVSSGMKQIGNRRQGEQGEQENRGKESIVIARIASNREAEAEGEVQNRKQLSYCLSPIKVDERSLMTPVDHQMINVLMKLADRMDRLEGMDKKKIDSTSQYHTQKNSRQKSFQKKSKSKSKLKPKPKSNIRIRDQTDSDIQSPVHTNQDQDSSREYSTTNLNQSQYQYHSRSRSRQNASKLNEGKPQIVINNIIKGKHDLSENKHSRIYDMMDYELRKQEEVIRRLEMERWGRKRYVVPDVTDFGEEEKKQKEIQKYKQKDQKRLQEIQRLIQNQKQNITQKTNLKQQLQRAPSQNYEISEPNITPHSQYHHPPSSTQSPNKKYSFPPSISSEYPPSNQTSVQYNFIKNINRNSFHREQTQTPLTSVLPQSVESRTEPVEVDQRKPVAFEFPVNMLDSEKENISLAEAFKRRHQFSSSRPKQQRRQKSKEELAELRRNMMRRRPTHSSKPDSIEATVIQSVSTSLKQSKREPSKQLLERLINGAKGPINKKEMRALTQKNYDQLPEVKQRREEARKREELQRRMMQRRQYDRSIRKHR